MVKILLFIILLFAIMLIVQAWRMAYFSRRYFGNVQPLWKLTLSLLSPVGVAEDTGWYGYISNYLDIASGKQLLVFQKAVRAFGSMTEEQDTEFNKDLDILDNFSHKTVMKYIIYESWTLEEFRANCNSLSEDLKLDEPVTPAGIRMLSYAKQFSRDYDIPLSRVLEVNNTYLIGTSDEWINERLKEKHLM